MPGLTPESARLSLTFLAPVLGCTTSAPWALEKRRDLRSAPKASVDAQAGLIQRKGQEREDRFLIALPAQHGVPVVIGQGNPNRFNFAISPARCLAVRFASPGLLDLVAKSVNEMRLANLFCWAAEHGLSSAPIRNAITAGSSTQ